MDKLFILGFEGTDIRDAKLLCREFNPAGWIIFSRNVEDEFQLRELTSSLKEICGKFPVFVSVDQEGGRVNRLPERFISPRKLTELYREDREAAKGELRRMASKLKELNFNLNFAPVLDVEVVESEIVGDRSFGSDPETVAEMGKFWIETFKEFSVESCGKHFPGHGGVKADSHLELPVDHVEESIWRKLYLPPFKSNFDRLNFMMLAHVIFEFADPYLPASLSVTTEAMLKREGYRGFKVSDDLLMAAVKNNFAPGEIARLLHENHTDFWIISRDYDFMESIGRGVVDLSWKSEYRDWHHYRLKRLERFWVDKL